MDLVRGGLLRGEPAADLCSRPVLAVPPVCAMYRVHRCHRATQVKRRALKHPTAGQRGPKNVVSSLRRVLPLHIALAGRPASEQGVLESARRVRDRRFRRYVREELEEQCLIFCCNPRA